MTALPRSSSEISTGKRKKSISLSLLEAAGIYNFKQNNRNFHSCPLQERKIHNSLLDGPLTSFCVPYIRLDIFVVFYPNPLCFTLCNLCCFLCISGFLCMCVCVTLTHTQTYTHMQTRVIYIKSHLKVFFKEFFPLPILNKLLLFFKNLQNLT